MVFDRVKDIAGRVWAKNEKPHRRNDREKQKIDGAGGCLIPDQKSVESQYHKSTDNFKHAEMMPGGVGRCDSKKKKHTESLLHHPCQPREHRGAKKRLHTPRKKITKSDLEG